MILLEFNKREAGVLAEALARQGEDYQTMEIRLPSVDAYESIVEKTKSGWDGLNNKYLRRLTMWLSIDETDELWRICDWQAESLVANGGSREDAVVLDSIAARLERSS